MDFFHDHELKEDKDIIEHLLKNEARFQQNENLILDNEQRLIRIIDRLLSHHPPKIKPVLAFNILINNTNLNFMAVVTSLNLTSTAPVELFMTVVDQTTGNPIAGVASGFSYAVADTTQDIAVVDPTNPEDVDIHAVSSTGGTVVTPTANFVSTLLGPDGVTPVFSGTITGPSLTITNNIQIATLNPVLAFNQ